MAHGENADGRSKLDWLERNGYIQSWSQAADDPVSKKPRFDFVTNDGMPRQGWTARQVRTFWLGVMAARGVHLHRKAPTR